jgi:hypothetical protein
MRRLRDGTSCLADVKTAQTVRIECILFDSLKDLCYGVGLAEGDVIRCRRASRSALVLETAEHRTLIFDSDWARFVQVKSVESGGARAESTDPG